MTRDCVPGQVVALFIVDFGEYTVVWIGTDWDKEIQTGINRNRDQAKIRALREKPPGVQGINHTSTG